MGIIHKLAVLFCKILGVTVREKSLTLMPF